MVQPAYKTSKWRLFIVSHSAFSTATSIRCLMYLPINILPTDSGVPSHAAFRRKEVLQQKTGLAQISTVRMNLRRHKMIHLSHSICYHLIKSNILILPSIHISVYPSFQLSIYPSIHLSFHPSFPLSIYLPIYNIYLSIHRRIYPCIHLSIQPSNVCKYMYIYRYRPLYIYILLLNLTIPPQKSHRPTHNPPALFRIASSDDCDSLQLNQTSFPVTVRSPERCVMWHILMGKYAMEKNICWLVVEPPIWKIFVKMGIFAK